MQLQSPIHLNDRLVLRSGLLEITYDTGAKVILQGPVTYRVDSAAGGYLSVGKLTARLEKKSASPANPNSEIRNPKSSNSSPLFSVRTPTAVVTDLGTEFGVEVSREGFCDVHVFVGAVRLDSHQQLGKRDKQIMLTADKSAHVGLGGDLTKPPMSRPTDFVRRIPRAVQQTQYAKAVIADAPLFYWNFDEPDGVAFEQMRHSSHQKLYPMGQARRSAHRDIGSGLALGCTADFSKAAGVFRSGLLEQGEMPGAWAIEFWAQATGDLAAPAIRGILETGAESRYGRCNPAIIFNDRHHGIENTFVVGNGYPLDAGSDCYTRGGPQITDHLWHHVILAFYGNGSGFGVADRVEIIVDTVSHRIQRRKFTSGFNMEGFLRVGATRDDLEDAFDGRIDELALYDLSKLTVKEIEAHLADMGSSPFSSR